MYTSIPSLASTNSTWEQLTKSISSNVIMRYSLTVRKYNSFTVEKHVLYAIILANALSSTLTTSCLLPCCSLPRK